MLHPKTGGQGGGGGQDRGSVFSVTCRAWRGWVAGRRELQLCVQCYTWGLRESGENGETVSV